MLVENKRQIWKNFHANCVQMILQSHPLSLVYVVYNYVNHYSCFNFYNIFSLLEKEQCIKL